MLNKDRINSINFFEKPIISNEPLHLILSKSLNISTVITNQIQQSKEDKLIEVIKYISADTNDKDELIIKEKIFSLFPENIKRFIQ